MKTTTRIENPNLHWPSHFVDVLNAIDFERLESTGLHARAVLYCADTTSGLCGVEQHYEGSVKERAGEIILPPSRIIARGRNGNQVERLELEPGEFPLELLSRPETPRYYEFGIDGVPSDSYNSIELFRTRVLPSLASRKSLNYNPNHTSTAWFYLSNEPKQPYNQPMLMLSGGGLEVLADSVGNIKVFTEKDLRMFANLKPGK